MTKVQRRGAKAPDRMVNTLSWRWAILKATAEEMPSTRALLLLALSCHMNDAGDGCWPSQATLAEETKLSRRAVQDHLKAATDAGWIVRTAVWKDGAVAGTVYHTAIPQSVLERMQAPAAAPVEDTAGDLQEGGGAGGAPPPVDTQNGEGVAQEVRRGGAGGAPGWRSTCAGVAQEVRPNSTGNSTGNSTEKENPPAKPSDSRSPDFQTLDKTEPEPMPPHGRPPIGTPPVKPMRVTQEELDEARSTVCRALDLPLKAWLPAHEFLWTKLWRECTGDLAELVKVFKLARRQREAAGHVGVTLRYVEQHYGELRSLIYQPSPASVPAPVGDSGRHRTTGTTGGLRRLGEAGVSTGSAARSWPLCPKHPGGPYDPRGRCDRCHEVAA